MLAVLDSVGRALGQGDYLDWKATGKPELKHGNPLMRWAKRLVTGGQGVGRAGGGILAVGQRSHSPRLRLRGTCRLQDCHCAQHTVRTIAVLMCHATAFCCPQGGAVCAWRGGGSAAQAHGAVVAAGDAVDSAGRGAGHSRPAPHAHPQVDLPDVVSQGGAGWAGEGGSQALGWMQG